MHLTIFFNGQFWVGLIEKHIDDHLFSAIHTFGDEPKDGTILHFVNFTLQTLIENQTESVIEEQNLFKKLNPKRVKKLAKLAASQSPVSTKSQEALRLQMEKDKKDKKKLSKEEKVKMLEVKRLKAVEKAKQKHLGH
ncbi:MAG: YjdF family protein [Bacteroidota bacterium]|nr:YjdF family protein [Bacteroidota bacterium]